MRIVATARFSSALLSAILFGLLAATTAHAGRRTSERDTVNIALSTPVVNGVTCGGVLAVTATFDHGLDSEIAQIAAILSSMTTSEDVSTSFSILPDGTAATAMVDITSVEQTFALRVTIDEDDDGDTDGVRMLSLVRFVPAGAPSVTLVSPGQVAPGDTVSIYGSGFCPGAQDNIVAIGGTSVAAAYATQTALEFAVPDMTIAALHDATLDVAGRTDVFSVEVNPALAELPITPPDIANGHVGGELLVVYEPTASQGDIASVTSAFALGSHQSLPEVGAYRVLVPGIEAGDLASLATNLAGDPRVADAVLNGINSARGDIRFLPDAEWPLGEEGTDAKLALASGVFPNLGRGVSIIVVDGGVDERIDFGERFDRTASYRSIGSSGEAWEDDAVPCRRHGTKIASIAASGLDAGDEALSPITAVGVAPEATVVSYRYAKENAADDACNIRDYAILTALLRAFRHDGPAVVNLSYGAKWPRSLWAKLLRGARAVAGNNHPVVMAVADDSAEEIDELALADEIDGELSVQATSSRARSSFDAIRGVWAVLRDSSANYGLGLDYLAPVASPWTDFSGTARIFRDGNDDGTGVPRTDSTSFAAPHVTGLNALILGEFPTLNPKEVESRIAELFTRRPDAGFLSTLLPPGSRCDGADLTSLEDSCVREFGKGTIDTAQILSMSGPFRLFARSLRPVTDNFSQTQTSGTWVNYTDGDRVFVRGSRVGDPFCLSDGMAFVRVRAPGSKTFSRGLSLLLEQNGCVAPGDPEADISSLFANGSGVYRVDLTAAPRQGSESTLADTWVESSAFYDAFNRPDGPVGNGWAQVAGGEPALPVEIVGGRATTRIVPGVGGKAGFTRPLTPMSKVVIAGQIEDESIDFGGGTRVGHFEHRFTISDDGSGNGYGVSISQSSVVNCNPRFDLWDGGNVIATHSLGVFCLGNSLPVDFRIEILASGQVAVAVTDFVQNPASGTTRSHRFSAPASTQSQGANFTWTTDVSAPSGPDPQRASLDNLTISVVP